MLHPLHVILRLIRSNLKLVINHLAITVIHLLRVVHLVLGEHLLMGILNILECAKCYAVIVILVLHVDERAIHRRVWDLLKAVLNLRVIVEN